jgi:cyclopropane-fatty-acyl-phospholipid synthase
VTTTYAGASEEAIRHHYDLGNDFFGLWLDRSLTYTCAMWGDEDGLESAQSRKLEYMIDAAGAQDAGSVLDVGCGWGSMMRRLTEGHGVDRVVGLTLSPAQEAFVSGLGNDHMEVRLEDWAEHVPDEPYDAIVAVGVIEHAAAFGRPRAENVAAYRRFFETCHAALKPGRRMSLQTIAKGNVPLDADAMEDAQFLAQEIFPLSTIPKLAELSHATEKLFEVRSVRNDREHYIKTLHEWRRRLLANRERAVAVVGEHLVEQYDRYLASSARHFERRQLTLLRFSLERIP